MTTGAIIVAAGRSERMGGIDKLFASLRGRPLLAYSVDVLASSPRIESLVVVASSQNLDAVAALTGGRDKVRVVAGGDRRRDSVRAGIDALPEADYILVHDGARPLVEEAQVEAALDGAMEVGASLCAIPVTDTVKRATPEGLVHGTVSRENLWLAQTPQAFERELLLRAHASFDIDATDDAALVELLLAPVKLVAGSQRNIKVTTPSDLVLAEALILRRED